MGGEAGGGEIWGGEGGLAVGSGGFGETEC